MYRLLFILPLLIVSTSYAKDCYWLKDRKVCLKRYYDTKNIKNPKSGEKYYVDKKTNNLFTFHDKIQIKLKYKGAILSILKNFNVEFYDKKNYGTLILKAKDPMETLSIITNLNHLDSVQIAKPLTVRKYRTSYQAPKYEMKEKKKEKKKGKVPAGANIKHFKIN